MESDTAILIGLIEKFKGIIKSAEEIKIKYEKIELDPDKVYSEGKIGEIPKLADKELRIASEVRSLSRYYDSAVDEFNQIMKERNKNKKIEKVYFDEKLGHLSKFLEKNMSIAKVPKLFVEWVKDSILLPGILQSVILGSTEAMKILEYLISSLPPEERDRLNGIRQQVENIKNEKIKHDLLISIKECEYGFYLGSSLITARVIDYVIDKIPGDDINKKIEFLRINGVIDKEDKHTAEFILKASKKARNYLAHKPRSNVLCAESLSLLGDCVKLVELLEKVENKRTSF